MEINEFDWDMLYEKVEKFIFNNGINDAYVRRNVRSIHGNAPVVHVEIPQKGNKSQIEQLRLDKNCFAFTASNKGGKRVIQVKIYADAIS